MRILVVGAGGTGGYFGGRLLEAGRDVTFLVRPRRAAELERTGLAIRSPFGDVTLASPPTVTADAVGGTYDLVLLSCKGYDLDSAMDSLAPAVGPDTAILPLLNGMRHLDLLDARFGAQHVLGGVCLVSAALDEAGRILHLNDVHSIAFGERNGARSARASAIAASLAGARFDSRASESILQEMWEKWVFIATVAGITCLMRAAIGDIVEAGAADLATRLLAECASIAATHGFPPRAAAIERSTKILTATGSALTASMFRDVERRSRTEADHIVGDLLRRSAGPPENTPLLRIVHAHLRSHEARLAREAHSQTRGGA